MNVTLPPIGLGSGCRRAPRIASSQLARWLLGVCLLQSPFLLAQPEAEVTRLLFEPVPLDTAGEPLATRPLVSFAVAEDKVPPPAAATVPLTREQRQELNDSIAAYRLLVGDRETTEGPYSSQLREDLFQAGLLYQQLDEHESALGMLERALAVSRINNGLTSLDQVPIMETMAQSHLALNDTSAADAMMDAAYNLQRELHGGLSTTLASALLKLGDWNTAAFMERSSILVNIPRMNVQNFMIDPRNYIEPNVDVRNTPLFKLYQARNNYLTALHNLIEAKRFNDPILPILERKLLTNLFLDMHQENILYEPDFYLTRKKSKTASRLNQNTLEMLNSDNYDLGRQTHRRILSYLFNNPEMDGATLAGALLEEADWELLFQYKTRGEDKYENLLEFFAANPELASEARELLYPAVPVILPTYLPPPNSREKLGIALDANVNFFGYIDVSFRLNKFGKSRSVRVLGKGGEVTRNMEIRLNQYLRRVQFRPRFGPEGIDTQPLSLRYYIGI